jgi:hypothetical protein
LATLEFAHGPGLANDAHERVGAFVNVIAYQTDYVEVREDLKLIEATARARRNAAPRKIGKALPLFDENAAAKPMTLLDSFMSTS